MSARVPMFGQPIKFVLVEPGSTKGATIGTNVWNADGSLFAPASVATPADDATVAVTLWRLVMEIPPNVIALAATATTGLYAVTAAGVSATRTLADSATIIWTNGSGVAGNPSAALADLANTGGGVLQKTARDGKGRITGTSAATTDDLPEAATPTNLYHTTARARAAAVADTLTDGVLDVAPSQNVVVDALALKAPLYRPQFTDWMGIGLAPDRPFIMDTGGNTLPAGSSSFMLVGDSNKERLEMRGSGSSDPVFQGKRSSGTKGAPGATAPSLLLAIGAAGHTGAGWILGNNALIGLMAEETFTATANGTSIYFATTAVGTTARLVRWTVESGGHLAPGADNAYDVGSGPLRCRVVYAGTGTISTSDASEKTAVASLTDAETAAAEDLAREIGSYQWLASVAEKGDGARHHIGLTVQRCIAIMAAHGLDPMRYGFVCYDQWDERVEPAQYEAVEITPAVTRDHPAIYERTQVYTDDGQPDRFAERLAIPAWTEELVAAVTEQRMVRDEQTHPAGDRYSFRMDQLCLFIAAGFEARLAALEAGGS